jgi:thioredoxin
MALPHSGFGHCTLKNPMPIEDFLEKLHGSPSPVVVDFWAPWCGPCRAIAPIIERLGQEYSGQVEVWKVNADEEPDLLRSLRIYGIPTLIAFHAGQEIGRRTGWRLPGNFTPFSKPLYQGTGRSELNQRQLTGYSAWE